MAKNKFFDLPVGGGVFGNFSPSPMGSFVSKYLVAHYQKVANLEKDITRLPLRDEFFFLQSDNSFNAFTFIPWILKQKKVQHLYASTYSINKRVIAALTELHAQGLVDQITLLVSDTMLKRNPATADMLASQARAFANLNVLFAWVHAKVCLLETKEDHYVIEGSGNWSENAYYEQYTFANSRGLFDFRKKLFTDVEIRYQAKNGVNQKI
ncbi:MAG: hypothetical protein CMM93_08695 [Rickettsiales bacterium]|nr:hypothetical protein [Rickettsiales bacterium]